MKRLIFDTANLLFRVAAAHGKGYGGDEDEKAGLALHTAINTCLKYFRQFKPDQVALTFESSKNWRKEYTRSADCVSKRVYKANRIKDPSMEHFYELIKSFEHLVREHTSLICLSAETLEGDDLFAGYVQRFAGAGDEVIGISGDKDFVQLLKFPTFRLINPDNGKDRTVEDVEFFLFEKCIRGDGGDNVMSAFPRVRKTRIEKAFNSEYDLLQLMNEEWEGISSETGEPIRYKVQDLFVENILLMDLEAQPNNIRQLIEKTLDYEIENNGKFSMFHFQKFLGKFKLNQISDHATNYVEMFSVNNKKLVSNKPVEINWV